MMNDVSMEQAILESAEKLFLERGFERTSTTDIAKDVGCNQSLINYYFRTKANLFKSIFQKKVLLFLSSLEKTVDSNIPFTEKLTIICESHFEMLNENPNLGFFLLNEILTNPERLENFKAIVKENFGKVFPAFEAELEVEIQEGTIKQTTLLDILLTMASLNIGVFLFRPILSNFVTQNNGPNERQGDNRGRENAKILLLSLKV